MTEAKRRRLYIWPLVWACLVVLLSSLPYLAGVMLRPSDGVFTGFTYNLDDACVYSSWVRQVADGHFLFRNLYTSQPQHALQFNLLFLVLGLIAKLTHVSPAAVLHLSRVLLGVGLLMFVWKFSQRFLRTPLERALVVPVVGLASGLGWILPKFSGHLGPVDLWQPEAITFLSIYLNPLFLAGMLLMLAAFHLLLRMKDGGSWADAIRAGVMLLLLANVHTYDVLTVGAVWAAYLIVDAVQARSVPWKTVLQSAVAVAIALPAIAYQFYLYRSEEVFKMRVESAAPSPALWAYLAGYGLLLVLAALAVKLIFRERRETIFLVVWAVIGFVLPYVPVAQQRKLVMGLHLPIAILATAAAAALAVRVKQVSPALVIILMMLVLVPSNMVFMARDIGMLQNGITAPLYPAYLSRDETAVLGWIRENTRPDDTVLTSRELALFVPPVAGNRVYFGHWSETPDFAGKLKEWVTFTRGVTPDGWRRWFLRTSGVRYVIYPDLRSFRRAEAAEFFDAASSRYLIARYHTPKLVVYEVDAKAVE